jgi:hypothetical protein
MVTMTLCGNMASRWADENQRYGDKICIEKRRNFCSRADIEQVQTAKKSFTFR